MDSSALLNGGNKAPYWIQGFRQEEGSLKKMLTIAERESISELRVAHSGLRYRLREDGWWLTSDSVTCDKTHGLPSEGRLIKKLTSKLTPD